MRAKVRKKIKIMTIFAACMKKKAKNFENIRTPFYYYDMDILKDTARKVSELAGQYGIEVHYATKANENARIVSLLGEYGFGVDCVSGDELRLALNCGIAAEKIVFAGVGKSDEEILNAGIAGIGALNVESVQELYIINEIARKYGFTANVCIRVNPNIDAHTFRYVTSGLNTNKFGVSESEFDELVEMLMQCGNVRFMGIHYHIGSQITDIENVTRDLCVRANKAAAWFESRGLKVDMINLGGGLGVNYDDPYAEPFPDFGLWFKTIAETIDRRDGRTIHVEPGRSLVAQCGDLITKVLFVKETEAKSFVVVDAGMNNLVRPAFYGSFHLIENLSAEERPTLPANQLYDVVGPVCESSDSWGKGRQLPLTVRGDLLVIHSAGAYGQSMSMRYTLRPIAQAVYSDRIDEAEKECRIL